MKNKGFINTKQCCRRFLNEAYLLDERSHQSCDLFGKLIEMCVAMFLNSEYLFKIIWRSQFYLFSDNWGMRHSFSVSPWLDIFIYFQTAF